MFPVEIWGNVAEWVGAVGTSGAAISAAAFYIVDSRKSQAAQARLIRVRFKNSKRGNHDPNRIVIQNNSDRHISGVYLLAKEGDLRAALLGRKMFVIPQIRIRKSDNQVVHFLMHTSDPLSEIKSKKEIIGYDGRAWITVDPTASTIEPGGERSMYLTYSFDPRAQFRVSTEYWLGFTDAHGICWERQVPPSHLGPEVGHLRRVPDDGGFGRIAKERWQAIEDLKHYVRVFTWLYRHRHETTSSEPPWVDKRDEEKGAEAPGQSN